MKKILLYCILSISFLPSSSRAQNIDSLKLALKNAKHDTTRCNILDALLNAENDDALWPKYNDEIIKLAESKLKTSNYSIQEYKFYKKSLATAFNNAGYSAQLQGDIYKALEYHGKSLKLMEELGFKQGIATSFNNIGLIYHNQGNISKALNYFDKSMKILEDLGDKYGVATSLNNIGFIYNNQGDIQKALELYGKSIKIREEIEDKEGIAISLSNIGIIYSDQGNFSKALDYHNMSLKISEEIRHKSGIASSLINIGGIYNKQGDIPKALEYYGKGLKILEDLGNKQGVATSLIHFSLLYFKQKNYSMALQYAEKAIKIGKEIGSPENIKNAAKQLNEIYKATGKYNLALKNYELYIQMRDSINNIETQKATIKQQSQYEYDKKKAIEDERHAAELKVQEDEAKAEKKKQNIIIVSVSIVLLLVAIFSILLYNRFKTAQKQKLVIEQKEKETQTQKHIIEEKQKEILDSINYAKRIQYTLLAHDEFLKDNLPGHFTYFNPKDIVSGDFYWAASTGSATNSKFYLAVCDSTGHGVPGAFMSLLNIGFLSEAINEKGIEKPNEVFNFVRQRLIDSISKEGQKDGFDGILICIDHSTKQITYAAANNNPILIQNNEIFELEADRMPVGMGERKEDFKLYTIDARPGDTLYLYTDGYADQFGGPKGKKFKYKQLNELLLAQNQLPLSEQHQALKQTFESWRGDLEQVDDVCVIGIRI